MAGKFSLKLVTFMVLLHAANLPHGTGQAFTSPPKEGLPMIFFFALKKSDGFGRV
jgi:hypothetical protein